MCVCVCVCVCVHSFRLRGCVCCDMSRWSWDAPSPYECMYEHFQVMCVCVCIYIYTHIYTHYIYIYIYICITDLHAIWKTWDLIICELQVLHVYEFDQLYWQPVATQHRYNIRISDVWDWVWVWVWAILYRTKIDQFYWKPLATQHKYNIIAIFYESESESGLFCAKQSLTSSTGSLLQRNRYNIRSNLFWVWVYILFRGSRECSTSTFVHTCKHAYIYIYIYTDIHTYIFIYMYIRENYYCTNTYAYACIPELLLWNAETCYKVDFYSLSERVIADDESGERLEVRELLGKALEHSGRHTQLEIVDMAAVPNCKCTY